MFIVYTEIFTETAIERTYYGTYDRNTANEVAMELGSNFPVFHGVCREEDADAFGVKYVL